MDPDTADEKQPPVDGEPEPKEIISSRYVAFCDILGFSNRWYKPAMESAEEREIASGLRIRVVTAPYFCAPILELAVKFARRS